MVCIEDEHTSNTQEEAEGKRRKKGSYKYLNYLFECIRKPFFFFFFFIPFAVFLCPAFHQNV